MEEKKSNTGAPKPQPKGQSKREKVITAVLAVVFVVGVVIVALVQMANGAS